MRTAHTKKFDGVARELEILGVTTYDIEKY